jgi:cytoplasmic iron level regulating protein YaaA (DUF328/UPF0246 family)
VLILLPPSEGKTAPPSGAPVDLASLGFPELTAARRRVGRALVVASGRRNALAALGAGASLADEVARNTTLWDNPTTIASRVYSGVLYDAADAEHWDPARAADRVRIISALWGVVSPADRIPAYRLSMGTSLGRIGPLAAFWRGKVDATLARETADRLVIDCRSSDYATVWRPNPAAVLAIRVEREWKGKRAVVSHGAKHTRGLLTKALLASPTDPTHADEVANIAAQIPGITAVEHRPGVLTLVTDA